MSLVAVMFAPRAGSVVVRMDPLRFLSGCLDVLSGLALSNIYISVRYIVLLFIRAPFYVL